MKRPAQIAFLVAAMTGAAAITAAFVPSATATRSIGVEAGDIAFIDVFTLVDRALMEDGAQQARTSFSEESNQQLTRLDQQMQTLQGQLQTLQPNDPNAGQLYQQYQQLQQQIQVVSQRVNQEYQGLIAEQIAAAYTDIYAAANELADAKGYSFVFATRADGELVQTDTITGITQEILARPLVTPPTGVDLTEQVRVKLGYPEESAAVYDGGAAVEPQEPLDAQEPAGEQDQAESDASEPTNDDG